MRAMGLACVMMVAAPGWAQTATLPDTPEGQYVRSFLAAVNDPDPQVIRQFDPRAVGMRDTSGGLDVVSVEPASGKQLSVVMHQRLPDDYLTFTFTFDGGSPPKVIGLRGTPAPRPAGAAPLVRMDDKALAAWVATFADKADYSGVVLVTRKDKPIVSLARGLFDREAKTPIRMTDKFRIGSMDKMFTATSILQLAQAGKVKLDAPLGAYLKDYPNKDFAAKVTVFQLLTHTGGAGDIFTKAYFDKRLEVKELKDYVALFGDRGADFTPGTSWRYANYGFILLGRIIEEASGQSYDAYVRDHIFKPASMTGSGFEPETANVKGLTKGYTVGPDGKPKSNEDSLPWRGTSAGGGYSTASDLAAFAKALTGYKLLDKAHTQMLTTRHANGSYAFGFDDASNNGVRLYGHSGGAPGMNGELKIVADGQVVVVALSNVSPPARASQVLGMILDRVEVTGVDGKPAAFKGSPPAQPDDATRMAAFKASDANGDGKLDTVEYKAMLERLAYPEMLETYWAQRDADKDGFISAAEVSKGIGQ